MANEYLKRQPTSSGNSRRWTVSFWMKNSDTTQGYTAIMGAGKPSPTNTYNEIFYNGSQTGLNLDKSSDPDNYNIIANPLLRDPSAWMHVVVSFTDQGDNANTRVKFYINGAFTDHNTTTGLDVSETSFYNHKDYIHYIGSRAQQSYGTNTFDAQYFDVFLVDGQALTPDVFGFYKEGKGYQSSGSSDSTDFGPGQWSPHSPRKIKSEIERKGGFGVNGFYLPMNDSSNPGADFHCDPNSIIKLKGEDLPQPRNGAPTTSDAYVSQLRQEEGTLGFDGAVKFDGTDDYISIGDSSDWDIGTAAFTLEGWVLIHSNSVSYSGIFGMHTGSTQFQFRINNVGRIQFLQDFGGTRGNVDDNDTSGHDLRDNKFHHVAMVRKSDNSWQLYVDGYLNYSGTGMTGNITGINEVALGRRVDTNSYYLNGFISNFRFVSGTAVYTSNFTPPTEPLTAITNTKLLCCNSSTSATASTITPATITANGGAFATRNELTGSIVLAVPGIAGGQGSGYGDYSADIKGSGSNKTLTASGNTGIIATPSYYGSALSFPYTSGQRITTNSNDFAMGTGDFTVEVWINPDQVVNYKTIFSTRPNNSSHTDGFNLWIDANGATGVYSNAFLTRSANGAIVPNQWTHVVAERYNNQLTTYINGVAAATATNTQNFTRTLAALGELPSQNTEQYDGLMQDIRVYKGVAKYKGGFNVPKPYTPVGIEDFRTTADTCKNNFATLNSLYLHGNVNNSWSSNITLSNGNLTAAWTSGTGSNQHARSNFAMLSGKWYFEGRMNATSGGDFGVAFENHINDSVGWGSDQLGFSYRTDGQKQNNTSASGYSGAYFAGDIIGCAYDADAGSISFYRNGSSLGTAFSGISIDQPAYFAVGKANSGATLNASVNFGQNPTFGNIAALNKNRINSSTADSVWHQSSNTGTHTDWTVSAGGTELDVAVPSGHYARVKLRSADGTIDPKKTYLLSFKYTTGPANLGVQNDQGYMTAVDGSASPNGLSSGNFYSFVVHGSSVISITGFTGSTYALDNVIVSEIDECYTDDSGKGKFHYQPPTGYLALCEDNLPTPAIADPGEHFKTMLYRGDSNNGHSVTGVGFQPDLVWIKERTSTSSHQWHDSVRGAGNVLISNVTSAESYSDTYLYSLDSDGFTLGTSGGVNASTDDYVAWCWKAGGPAVANNDGSITSQVSVNQTAGFSIVSYTGTGANATVGHGLDKTPKFIITKNRDASVNWVIYHSSVGATQYLRFTTNAATTQSSIFNDTEPTSSVFSLGSSSTPNGNGQEQIAYCWAEIEGYSKFGNYNANGVPNGNFVYCGFKPAWLMIKPYGTGNGCYSGGYSSWSIYDSSRSPVNNPTMHERVLFANRSYQEGKRGNGASSGAFQNIDLLSNGFKLRGNSNCEVNTSSINGFIFVAFAESPFQTANAK